MGPPPDPFPFSRWVAIPFLVSYAQVETGQIQGHDCEDPMQSRRVPAWAAVACLLFSLSGGVLLAADDLPSSDKVAVIDGHVVHDVGQIGHNVTNWGLIGSAPSLDTPFSDAPSAMWPIWSGNEYLWAAGLWVGGVVLGEELVSTGSFQTEFLPTEAAADTIYQTLHGAPGGNRYPWPDADDDADGLEDEEILNGLDDDGDGLVDEDFAAIGDQHFVCAYNDHEVATQEAHPDHTPLNVDIVQQSIQWSNPVAEDFIGYDFTITNVGVTSIQQVHLGLFSDFDIGPRDQAFIAGDDYAGFISTMVEAANGTTVPVQVAYMYDGYDGTGGWGVDGYAGWVLCGHTTDPAGQAAPTEPGVLSFQRFSGNVAFEQGGDPTNDAERYELLSRAEWDPDALPGQAADYRVLMSSGPFASLEPGQSLHYQVALVLGAGLDEMVANAAEAVAAYRGISYDRDGDPANGQEFTVHWLLGEDAPVAAGTGRILAQAVPGGVQLQIESNLDRSAGLAVVRRAGTGAAALAERRWAGADLQEAGLAGSHHLYQVLDTDLGGWPRQYDLLLEQGGSSLALNQASLELPAPMAVALSASPNPFNPRVSIRFSLPEAGHVQLQVFDLRGRLVRTLMDQQHAQGTDTVLWQGDDDQGRALASGVYQLRLTAAGSLAETRVTLLR